MLSAVNLRRNARHLRPLLRILALVAIVSVGAHLRLRVTTGFFEAVQRGDVSRVRAWLARDATLANRPDPFGATALHYAALWGHVEVAALLLERGADAHAFAADGKTPLHIAATCGNEEVAALLIAHGADVHARDYRGRTPLHSVVSVGFKFVPDIEIARQLLDHGANVEAQDCGGWTPLHWAASHDHGEMTRLLIEEGSFVDLFIASSLGDLPSVAGFLESQPGLISATTSDGLTALHCAAAKGQTEVVRFLLAHDAEADPPGSVGSWTPLQKAASNGHGEVVVLLIAHGANVNALNPEGESILRVALLQGRDEIAHTLRAHGAR